VLRVVRQTPAAPVDEPRVIGVDDWALKKGRCYGTVIVNLETQRVIDLLPDRTAEILTEWLQAHPGIEVVARDRSTETSAVFRRVLPKRYRSRIAGICCSIFVRCWNAFWARCTLICRRCR
jgi:transposase